MFFNSQEQFVKVLKSLIVFYISGLSRLLFFFRILRILLFFGQLPQLFIIFVKPVKFLFRQIFNINQPVAGFFIGCYQFIKLYLNSFGIFVLGFLNQKYHQESYNCGPCIDNKLPGFRITEKRSANSPYNNQYTCRNKSTGTSCNTNDTI